MVTDKRSHKLSKPHQHVYGKTERKVNGAIMKFFACKLKVCPDRQLIAYDMEVLNRNSFEGKHLVEGLR